MVAKRQLLFYRCFSCGTFVSHWPRMGAAGANQPLEDKTNVVMKSSMITTPIGTKTTAGPRPLLANLSLISLITTIFLIGLGSFVRVTGHGLGCPDWPLCYGRAIPPLDIGAWVEFSHRFVAGVVGLQIVALAVLAWRYFRRERWILWPALAGVALLALQVELGRSHVLQELPAWTGFVHTGTAMLIAAVMAVLVAVSQPALQSLSGRLRDSLAGTRLPLGTTVTAVISYILIISGSLVTRTGASLACPSFPHCGYAVIPEYLSYLVSVQMIHRYIAFVLAFLILLLAWQLWQPSQQDAGLRRFVYALVSLLALQFALGISNIWLALPLWSRILHLMVAGTIWTLLVLLAVVMNQKAQLQPK
jgi:heme A synthase